MTDNSIRFCARCGKEIVGRHPNARYCSEGCAKETVCTVPGCDRKSRGHSLCMSHYRRAVGTHSGAIARRSGIPAELRGTLYERWKGMRQRCNNPNHIAFSRYGGRGVKVCERWDDFFMFAQDMGLPPSDRHSVDRIDPDGDYSPGNCRWSTPLEQRVNSRQLRVDREYIESVCGLYAAGISQERIAKRIGSGRRTVARALQLAGVLPVAEGQNGVNKYFCTPTENAAHAR